MHDITVNAEVLHVLQVLEVPCVISHVLLSGEIRTRTGFVRDIDKLETRGFFTFEDDVKGYRTVYLNGLTFFRV